MKRFFIICTALFALTLPAVASAAENAKIGFVDPQRLMSLSTAGKEAKDQMNVKFKKYQDELNRKQEELKSLRETIEKQGQMLTEAARSAKEKEYQQGLKDLQRLQKDANDDLQATGMELDKKIVGEIQKVVKEYGQKNGYTFIFIKDEGLIYADDRADLTDQIASALNSLKK
jgi:outer membrane protein